MIENPHVQHYAAWVDFDLEAVGRQEGSLHISLSANDSAYRAYNVPLVVLRNGEGPACLVTGGTHGDEWEGQIVAARLARDLKLSSVSGALYIMPHANMPACVAGTRLSPLDGGNLNLVWPAPPGAEPTGQIARFIEAEILPRVDLWIDIHTGGSTLIYEPKAAVHVSSDPDLNRRVFAALAAFGAPENLIFEVQEARSASSAAQRHGVPYIYGEFGGGSQISRKGIDIAWNGVKGALQHLGIVRSLPMPNLVPQRYFSMSGADYAATRGLYWFAEGDGFFEQQVSLGDQVEPGDVIGFVHPLDGSLSPPRPAVVQRSGIVVCLRAGPRVRNGDCLGHAGIPAEREHLLSRWC